MTSKRTAVGAFDRIQHKGFFAKAWNALFAFKDNTVDLDRAADPTSVVEAAFALSWLNRRSNQGEVGQWVVPQVTMDPDGIISFFWEHELNYKYAAVAFYPDHFTFYWAEPRNDVHDTFTIEYPQPFGRPLFSTYMELLNAMETRCPRYD